jgi:radical SAM protein with 4Fe4S-binding SPASM domain
MIGDDIFKIGNVKENSYKEVLTSDSSCAIIASSINDVYICDACAYKPYCGLCPVCNYAEQGGIIAKIAQTNRCKIFKAQFTYIFDKLVNNKEAEKIFLDWIERP